MVEKQNAEVARFFPGCDLEAETFNGLELISTDLSHSKLIDCTFENCLVSSPLLNDTVLQASFQNCKIQGINFFLAKRALMSLKFEGCLITYCSFAELSLPAFRIENCTLEHVDFADAKLVSAKFNGTRFSDCTFKNTDLSKADFRNCTGYVIDPTLNKLGKARFDLPEAVSLLASFNIRLD